MPPCALPSPHAIDAALAEPLEPLKFAAISDKIRFQGGMRKSSNHFSARIPL